MHHATSGPCGCWSEHPAAGDDGPPARRAPGYDADTAAPVSFAEVRWIVRGLLVLTLVYVLVTRALEKRRIARPLPRAGTPPPERLSAEAILADARELSSARYEGRRTGTPGGRVARAFIAERFRTLGLTPLSPGFLQPFSFVHRSIRALWQRDRPFRMAFPDAANVVGLIEGHTGADRYFVISAHYDHLGRRGGAIYPGADDNASGVAALLGMAAYFKQHRPAHTLLFVAFDAEELGRRGSRAFMASPPVPAERIAFNLNMDMIARVDSARFFAAGTGHHSFLVPLLEGVARRHTVALHLGHDRSIYRTGFVADWTTSSDHAVFHEHGIPFLCFSVENHADYHRPADTFERIAPPLFLTACEIVLDTLMTLDREWPAVPRPE
jgi:hypothetical protein